MNVEQIVAFLTTLAAAFFKSSPALTEVEVVLPQLATAFDSAKAGTAFSISHSLSVGGKPGTFSANWTPN